MKKYLFIIAAVIGISSCEKDDFCTQNPVTPNLLIKFMDKDDTSKTKQTDSLYVWVNSKDSIYTNAKLDSISIPLNSIAKKTIYNFAKGKNAVQQITIEYTPKEEFVSRSCGYRVIFNNLKISKNNPSNSWINNISTSTETINNQSNAHVKIYH